MCELPDVNTCFQVVSIRVGMILIAVLSITTGAVTLGVVEQKKNLNFEKVRLVYANVTETKEIIPNLDNIISSSACFMGFVFMIAGVSCLYGTLAAQDGCAQAFVFLIIFNIFIGFILVITVTLQCSFLDRCTLGNMDWLSQSFVLIFVVAYLILWYYFCAVVNSFVLKEHI